MHMTNLFNAVFIWYRVNYSLFIKAKPEEVEMLRGLLDAFIDETMEILAPEVEEAEEEEQPVPEVSFSTRYPGIYDLLNFRNDGHCAAQTGIWFLMNQIVINIYWH